MQASIQTTPTAIKNWRIFLILALALGGPAAFADALEMPPGLVKKVAARESVTALAEKNYTYRQSVELDEIGGKDMIAGEYREVRDIIFSPPHERTEEFVGKPESHLTRLKLTDEDFRDIREIQPFLFTTDNLFLYETKFRGEETIDGMRCWVLQVRPRQILEGQRLFDGLVWVDQRDDSIIRSEGQAVPQIFTSKGDNLFPHFTTTRAQVDGFWFPSVTYSDDELPFRTGPQHIRMKITYSDYKRFAADSTVKYAQ